MTRPADTPVLPAAPPLLVGAGLLLWGWQNALLAYAVPMALVLEGARMVSWRWPISTREFYNVADLSGVIFFIVVLYVFGRFGSMGIFTVLSLLPFVLFLLLLVQQYSEAGQVRLSALFVSLRRLDPEHAPDAGVSVDLTIPFFLVTLVSASAGNRHDELFFAVTILLLAGLLWSLRPRRYGAAAWCAMFLLTGAMAYAGQRAIVYTQYMIEGYVMQVFDRYLWRYRDPDLATTAIGSIGRIKFSDRITLRVRTSAPLSSTLLLREATYDTYGYGMWSNQRKEFSVVDPEPGGNAWDIQPYAGRDQVSIAMYMPRTIGVVPVPHGVTRIHDVGATEITRNAYGAVRMEIREGWIRYAADYGLPRTHDAAPDARDLYISDTYADTFAELARRLQLRGLPPAAVVDRVRAFFADGFTYSLTQHQRYPRGRYLEEFLFHTRSGHCEFFATSTVLLLRAAGIPARYAVGYAVDEFSPLEQQYVARARDAHSWTLYYLDGTWRVLDTTPSTWGPAEDAGASSIQPLMDLWSWISFRFLRWQSSDAEEKESDNSALLWLLFPLLGILLWRLYFKERVGRGATRPGTERVMLTPGLDSGLYRVVTELEAMGYARPPGETLVHWFERRREQLGQQDLGTALQLHYRYRFDPAGVTEQERIRLDTLAEAALLEIRRAAATTAAQPQS